MTKFVYPSSNFSAIKMKNRGFFDNLTKDLRRPNNGDFSPSAVYLPRNPLLVNFRLGRKCGKGDTILLKFIVFLQPLIF